MKITTTTELIKRHVRTRAFLDQQMRRKRTKAVGGKAAKVVTRKPR